MPIQGNSVIDESLESVGTKVDIKGGISIDVVKDDEEHCAGKLSTRLHISSQNIL